VLKFGLLLILFSNIVWRRGDNQLGEIVWSTPQDFQRIPVRQDDP
jgi:hypothetical protein